MEKNAKRYVYLIPVAIMLVLGVFFWRGLGTDPSRLDSVLINQPLPPLDLAPIKGRDRGLTSADFEGRVTLVNIFGSWCVSCRVEHPFLMALAERSEIPIYGIDWREKTPDDGPRWLARYGDPYTLIGDDPKSKAAIAFGVSGAPESFIVDKKGIIRYKHVGPLNETIWQETLKPLIAELRKQ